MRADQVSMEVFGSVDYTERIIRLNPDIVKLPVLPVGTLLKLPEREESKPKGVNLWS
jgi:phage tail protein X